MAALLAALFLGFAPMLFFAWLVFWSDRWEKEPLLLLGGVFVWGALVAAGTAFVLNSILGLGIYLFTGSDMTTELATTSVVAPVIEECMKGLAVLLVFLFYRSEFDSILDGIIYAAITALGFTATENTLYIYRDGYLSAGYQGIALMSFIRVALVGWQHPFYSAFTGSGLAIARLNRARGWQWLAPVFGLTLAIILHAVHNLFAVSWGGITGFIFGSVFDWSGWVFMLLFVLWAIYREHRWIADYLREEVTLGNLTAAQYHTAASPLGGSTARWGALMNGQYRPTNRFYQVCAELAFKKHQLRVRGEEKENSRIIARLRSELAGLSPHALS